MYYYQYTSLDYNKIKDISTNYIDNTCLICLDDDNNDLSNKIISINDYTNNIKNIKVCLCNSFFHKKCLELWFSKKKCCPICRCEISKTQQQLIHTISYQWEETFIIDDEQVQSSINYNVYSSRVLRFIIFISSINVFYILIYLFFLSNKNSL
jgi:hypothetical protein